MMMTESAIRKVIDSIMVDLAVQDDRLTSYSKRSGGVSLRTMKSWQKKQAELVSALEHYTDMLPSRTRNG